MAAAVTESIIDDGESSDSSMNSAVCQMSVPAEYLTAGQLPQPERKGSDDDSECDMFDIDLAHAPLMDVDQVQKQALFNEFYST